MNIPPSTGLTGYHNTNLSNPPKASVPIPPTPAVATLQQEVKTAEVTSRRSFNEAESSIHSSALSEAEYLPARYDDSERNADRDSQRPEIQAFLSTSTANGTSRRGRFIDIQA